MKRLCLIVSTAVVILPWLAGARAQADVIHWTASGRGLGPNLLPEYGVAFISPQNGVGAAISLLPGKTTSGSNSGSVVAVKLVAGGIPDRMDTAIFGGPSANYSLSLMLHDDDVSDSGSLTFRGNLSGWIDTDDSAHFTNTFLGPTTQSLILGTLPGRPRRLYTVTIGPFVSPSLFDPGSISAAIDVQPGPAVEPTPEPSSRILACLGLPSLGLAGWLRRRHRRKGVVFAEMLARTDAEMSAQIRPSPERERPALARIIASSAEFMGE
jgi:hypothetical protein